MVVPGVAASDETLAALAATGDDRAFGALVERYQARVFRLACRLTSETDAAERLDRARLAAAARVALDRLPDLYREAFVLRDLEELSTTEVAQVLGVEAATVRQRVHRARLLLRGYLQALGEEPPCTR
jgi:RNA polymerase sigma factor (sigma-70 family)